MASTQSSSSSDIVCTIAEKDYLYGAAALYNSLVSCGFAGEFAIFSRSFDEMPRRLVSQMRQLSRPRVHFRTVDTLRHLALEKARCMLSCFREWDCAETVTYFDPDIVVHGAPWEWINTWCQDGVALAADVNWQMPMRHPLRRAWARLLQSADYGVCNQLDTYFNAGFVSVARKDAGFCVLWDRFIDRFGATDKPLELRGEIKDWPRKGRWETVELPDQDTLNMAAMVWDGGLTTLGPDMMGFTSGSAYLPHALGFSKPWKRNYLAESMDGRPPRLVDKIFWDYAGSPINLLSPQRIALKKLQVSVTAAIGRFYRR